MEIKVQNNLQLQNTINVQHLNADIELLSEMGFDRTMINKIYLILNPQNINNAINYMLEINGIYQHNFIDNYNPNERNLCFICNKPRQNHINYVKEDIISDTQTDMNLLNNTINSNYINQERSDINININNGIILEECKICFENISLEDKENNKIKCGHLFCTNCWFNYLKYLILEAKVDKIKCMNHECNEIISEEFILKHISENDDLVQKYKKFKKSIDIEKDKNKKICPNPNCDSFLEKINSSKYVKCEYGHTYCFDCLNPPHGNKPCDKKSEIKFLKWTKDKKIKRCPNCKIFTQKDYGCNHMTCAHCGYQWCWICEQEYQNDHYTSGKCKGLQFIDADNYTDIDNYRNYCGLHKIFRCVFRPINGPLDFHSLKCKYLIIFIFWFIGYGFLFSYILTINYDRSLKIKGKKKKVIFIILILAMGLCLLVPFEILFTCIVTPFIIISLIYHKFFGKLLILYGIGLSNDE